MATSALFILSFAARSKKHCCACASMSARHALSASGVTSAVGERQSDAVAIDDARSRAPAACWKCCDAWQAGSLTTAAREGCGLWAVHLARGAKPVGVALLQAAEEREGGREVEEHARPLQLDVLPVPALILWVKGVAPLELERRIGLVHRRPEPRAHGRDLPVVARQQPDRLVGTLLGQGEVAHSFAQLMDAREGFAVLVRLLFRVRHLNERE